jgi:translation initiation factor IF-1
MVSISKSVGILFCGFLLCMGLSNAAQADDAAAPADKLKADQSDRRQGGQEAGEKQMNDMEGSQSKGGKTIKGEVLGFEGENIVVKGKDGKEVRLHVDETTQKERNINIEPGDRIEAKVTNQNHALSILSDQAIQDRRNAKE